MGAVRIRRSGSVTVTRRLGSRSDRPSSMLVSVKDASKWEAKADSLYVKWVDAPSQRGNILADDGSLLATSLPFFDIHFDAKAEGLNDEIFNDEAVDSLGWLLSTYIDQQFTPGAYVAWLRRLRDTTDIEARRPREGLVPGWNRERR